MTRFDRFSTFYKAIALMAILLISIGFSGIIITHALNDSPSITIILKSSILVGIGATVLAFLLLTSAKKKKEYQEYRKQPWIMFIFLLFSIVATFAYTKYLQKPLAGFYSK